jgi:hypothetical protein
MKEGESQMSSSTITPIFSRRTDQIKYDYFNKLVEKLREHDEEYDLPSIISKNIERVQSSVHGVLVEGWHDEWKSLSKGPREVLYSVMLGIDEHSIEMRQNSPFGGILTEEERVSSILLNSKI